jgi:hypothetical protein
MISTLTNKVHILNLSYFHLQNCLSSHSYLDGKKQKLLVTEGGVEWWGSHSGAQLEGLEGGLWPGLIEVRDH